MLQTGQTADRARLAQEEGEVRQGLRMLPERLLEIMQLDLIRNQSSGKAGRCIFSKSSK